MFVRRFVMHYVQEKHSFFYIAATKSDQFNEMFIHYTIKILYFFFVVCSFSGNGF